MQGWNRTPQEHSMYASKNFWMRGHLSILAFFFFLPMGIQGTLQSKVILSLSFLGTKAKVLIQSKK